MRAFLLAALLGCSDEEHDPVPWTTGMAVTVAAAGARWSPHVHMSHEVLCSEVEGPWLRCSVARVEWEVGLTAERWQDDRGRWLNGEVHYKKRRVWLYRGVDLGVAMHEWGHVLMPSAGRSPSLGHTATGIMAERFTSLDVTPEVLAICRAEGACHE